MSCQDAGTLKELLCCKSMVELRRGKERNRGGERRRDGGPKLAVL